MISNIITLLALCVGLVIFLVLVFYATKVLSRLALGPGVSVADEMKMKEARINTDRSVAATLDGVVRFVDSKADNVKDKSMRKELGKIRKKATKLAKSFRKSADKVEEEIRK